MIFVNDLWTLTDIPAWLGHVSAETDGMGLADFVFPAFLFIVGLSVPFAIANRKSKGDSDLKIFYHVIMRTLALLVMGVFLVNSETYPQEEVILSKSIWMILLVIAFFLIWLNYPKPETKYVGILKIIGVNMLIILSFIFQTEDSLVTGMELHWWGILGLIGWAYFTASGIYLFSKGNIKVQYIALFCLLLFSCASFLGWLSPIEGIKDYIWLVGEGSMATFSMAGVIAALVYKNLGTHNQKFWILLIVIALLFIVFGLLTRPIWGISKIKATPSWTTICTGLSIITFLIIVYITDVLQFRKWYSYIKPAGTSTLTAYLIPYIHYAILGLISIRLPEILRTGDIGLIKSFLYALFIVGITGYLEHKKIHLKI